MSQAYSQDNNFQSITFQKSPSGQKGRQIISTKDQLNQSELYDYLCQTIENADEVYDRIVNIVDQTLNQNELYQELKQDNILYLKEIQNLSSQINQSRQLVLKEYNNDFEQENKYLLQTIKDIQMQMFQFEEENESLRKALQAKRDDEEFGSQRGQDIQISQETYWKKEYLTLKDKYNQINETLLSNQNQDEIVRQLERERHNLEIRLINLEQDHQLQIMNLKDKSLNQGEANDELIKSFQIQQFEVANLKQKYLQKEQDNIILLQQLKDHQQNSSNTDNEIQKVKKRMDDISIEDQDLKNKIEIINIQNQRSEFQIQATKFRIQIEDLECQLELSKNREQDDDIQIKLHQQTQQQQDHIQSQDEHIESQSLQILELKMAKEELQRDILILMEQLSEKETTKSKNHKMQLSEDLKSTSEQMISQNMKDLIVKYRSQYDSEVKDHLQTKKYLKEKQQELEQIQNELEKITVLNTTLKSDIFKQSQNRQDLQNLQEVQKLKQQNLQKMQNQKAQEQENKQNQLLIQFKTLNNEVQTLNNQIKNIKRSYSQKFNDVKEKLKLALFSIFQSLQLEKESIKVKTLQIIDVVGKNFQDMIQQFIQRHKRINGEVLTAQQEIYSREWSNRSELLKNQLQNHYLQNREKVENEFKEKTRSLQKQILEQQSAFEIRQNENQTKMNIQRDQIDSSQSSIRELKEQLAETIEHFKNQQQVYNQQLSDKDDIIIQQQKKAQDIGDQLVKQNLSNQLKIDKIKEQSNETGNINRKHLDMIDQLEKDIARLLRDLQHKEDVIKQISSQKNEIEQQVARQADTNIKLKSDEQYLKSQNEELMQEMSYFKTLMKEQIHDFQQKMTQMDVENQQLRRKQIELESQLSVFDQPTKGSGIRERANSRGSTSTHQRPTQMSHRINSSNEIKSSFLFQENPQDKSVNMTIAKYKYETNKNDSIQQLEDNHLRRLQNIKSCVLRQEKYY